jgi:putative intracellular protease/amidase
MKNFLLLLCAILLPTMAQAAPKKVLIVLTSHSELMGSGKKTGFWFEEMSTPYYVLEDAGIEVTLASVRGGMPPADPRSDDESIASVKRFKADAAAMKKLTRTIHIVKVKPEEYDAVFLAGGHGTMWDFTNNTRLDEILQHFVDADKPIAAVCHGPAALLALRIASGEPFVKGRKVTAFTKSEEIALKLENFVPSYLDIALKTKGVEFIAKPNFQPNVVQDKNLITGQNPASSEGVAEKLKALLKE